MPSSQVRPLAQGPPSLVKGSRASGSADEVLVIALALVALTYDKRCSGEDEHGHSLEGVMVAVDRANLAKILSCRIDPPTLLVYGGWHGKGRGKKTRAPKYQGARAK